MKTCSGVRSSRPAGLSFERLATAFTIIRAGRMLKRSAPRPLSLLFILTYDSSTDGTSRSCSHLHSYPPTPSLPRQALFPWPYVEGLNDARTKLADFFNLLLHSFGHAGKSLLQQQSRRDEMFLSNSLLHRLDSR